MEFDFYNVTSICGLTSMITFVCAKTRMIWLLLTASKLSPVRIIPLIITILNNEQQPCKRVRVDEDFALKNSTYATNLLVGEFKISMETTGGDVSWLSGKNKKYNRRIHNMVISGLFDIDQHANKWCCEEET